jgi:hypothetical protein
MLFALRFYICVALCYLNLALLNVEEFRSVIALSRARLAGCIQGLRGYIFYMYGLIRAHLGSIRPEPSIQRSSIDITYMYRISRSIPS